MRTTQSGLAAVTVVAGLALGASLVYQANGQAQAKIEPPPTLNEIVQAGLQAAIDSERAGEILLAKLRDETVPTKDRAACALALGKLHYKPGIRRLIDIVLLDAPKDDALSRHIAGHELPALPASVLDNYPCGRA